MLGDLLGPLGSPVLPGVNVNAMDETNSGTASAGLPTCSCLFFRFLKGFLCYPRPWGKTVGDLPRDRSSETRKLLRRSGLTRGPPGATDQQVRMKLVPGVSAWVGVASVILCAGSMHCTGSDPAHGTQPDAGADGGSHAKTDGPGTACGSQESSAETGSADDSSPPSADDGRSEASTQSPHDASPDTSAPPAECRRDGGGKAGECCVTQDDCEAPPFSSGLCCRKHVCVSCSDMR
jgi:hypothetical protein